MVDIVGAIVMVLIFILGIILGRSSMLKYKNKQPLGNLRLYTGDPDGVYMTLESYVTPEYIMTQKEVTLSVDITDVSQK